MKRVWQLFVIASLTFASLAAAQTKAPTPGPEHKKMEYFVGKWSIEGDMKPSPIGPGGKFTGSDEMSFMAGGFFLVNHSDFKSAMGDSKVLAIMGYDTNSKVYTYNQFDSTGQAASSTGTVDSDTWTWNADKKMNGVVGRYIMKVTSPTSYTFKFEGSEDGKTWNLFMEGKATKVQ